MIDGSEGQRVIKTLIKSLDEVRTWQGPRRDGERNSCILGDKDGMQWEPETVIVLARKGPVALRAWSVTPGTVLSVGCSTRTAISVSLPEP